MSKVAVFHDGPDGCATGSDGCAGLHIIIPAYNDPTRPPNLTDDEFYEYALARTFAAAQSDRTTVAIHAIEHLDIPSDRVFRNAWECPTGSIQVNMPKARIIHMDVIRKVRNAELAKLDIPFMRAVETGDTGAQATIAVEKQTLRDIPQTFDLTARTPQQLKEKWPTELPARTA